ncbi:MAG: hypothetical protein ABFD18_08840 [Syntrophomonas sp.]
MKNYATRIMHLVILLVLIIVFCTGCRHSPLLERVVYVHHAEQINLDKRTKLKNSEKMNSAAQEKNVQDAMDNKINTDQQGAGQANAQPDTTQEGNGDTEYGGTESGDGALGQAVTDHGEHVEVPESVANVTTVMQDTKKPQSKSSWVLDRSKYIGDKKNGMFDGQGTYSWDDGDNYTGKWQEDFIEGQGTYTWANGDEYEGEWKDNQFTGQGTYTWPSGSTYTGEWKDGVKEGRGTYTWANGDKYVGEWKDGVKDGQGTYTWADGSIYTGEWKYGVREGRGTYKGADGTTYIGMWSDDKFTAR